MKARTCHLPCLTPLPWRPGRLLHSLNLLIVRLLRVLWPAHTPIQNEEQLRELFADLVADIGQQHDQHRQRHRHHRLRCVDLYLAR